MIPTASSLLHALLEPVLENARFEHIERRSHGRFQNAVIVRNDQLIALPRKIDAQIREMGFA